MKRIIRVPDELDRNGSHADAIRAMQKILSKELDRIEDRAWELSEVERTPEAVEEILAWFEEPFSGFRKVRDISPEDLLDDDEPPEWSVSDRASVVLMCIFLCRQEIDRWLFPEIVVTSLASAAHMIGCLEGQKCLPTVADIMSLAGKRAAHSRHTEAREKAEAIKAWYRANEQDYSSMDAAAEKVMKIIGVSFRTARKYVGEEAKIIKGKKHDR